MALALRWWAVDGLSSRWANGFILLSDLIDWCPAARVKKLHVLTEKPGGEQACYRCFMAFTKDVGLAEVTACNGSHVDAHVVCIW